MEDLTTICNRIKLEQELMSLQKERKAKNLSYRIAEELDLSDKKRKVVKQVLLQYL